MSLLTYGSHSPQGELLLSRAEVFAVCSLSSAHPSAGCTGALCVLLSGMVSALPTHHGWEEEDNLESLDAP